MITRIVNLTLCLVVIVGLVSTWQARSQRNTLRQEHDALAARFGSLDVRNPDKLYLTRLVSDDPYQFLWRMYCPEQLPIGSEYQSYSGSGSSRSSGDGGEHIVRVRFRFEEAGIGLFVKQAGSATTTGIGNPAFGEFLQTHWDELKVQAMPVGESQEIEVDQVIKLVSIEIPESLLPEARKALGRHSPDAKIEPVLQYRMGTPEAFEAEKKAQAEM